MSAMSAVGTSTAVGLRKRSHRKRQYLAWGSETQAAKGVCQGKGPTCAVRQVVSPCFLAVQGPVGD